MDFSARLDTTLQLWISGRVQGVGYRAGLAGEARAQDLRGWVRNLRDGRVEAVVQGRPEAVEHLLAWCRHGPPMARVEAVQSSQLPGDVVLPAGFETRPTA